MVKLHWTKAMFIGGTIFFQMVEKMRTTNIVPETFPIRPNMKVSLIVLFDYRGVVHHEFLPQVEVKKKYYLLITKNGILHHANGPAHPSLLLREYLVKKAL